jgi:transcriptional regulator with XRE-family HTH domain
MMIGHTQLMADKRIKLGLIGEAVRANIQQRRDAKNLTYAQLSRKLAEIGRKIPELGLRRIEEGNRRVDTDDLVALALALETSPITLLMPVVDDSTELVPVTENIKLPAVKLWKYLATDPSGASVVELSGAAFMLAAQPQWEQGRWFKGTESDGDN